MTARDRDIIEAYQNGRGMRDIARERGMFVRDVSAIIGELKRKGGSSFYAKPSDIPRVLFSDVVEQTAAVFGVTVADIKGQRRTRDIVRPRQVCCYLARQMVAGISYPVIGNLIGDRDHSTVIHACEQIPLLMQANPEFAAYVDAIAIRARADGKVARSRRRLAIMRKAEIDARESAKEKAICESAIRASVKSDRNPDDLDDMDALSLAVSNHKARGGDFIEARR